ncbi:MAG TPA: DUF87 domain-containing protein [Rhizomicrobium sp.]|nr:DUF87 domain-containing protein [Rhizomicrobium sp.]
MFEFAGSNLKNLLLGGVRGREQRETRQAWDDTQLTWRASPLAKQQVFDLSLGVLRDAVDRAGRSPTASIVGEAGVAIEKLLRGESITDLEALWDIIDNDMTEAVEFRRMLVRRRRWASDFERMYGSFKRITASALATFFEVLPESCYADVDPSRGDTFEVPLIDLLADPAAIIERLFMLPYDDESFRFDLFYSLRELCSNNMLVASGYMRTDNIHELGAKGKLVSPSRQKNKTGAELAELYLGGSPLKELLDVPVPFQIPDELRFEHCHIVGGTGHGKTQLMQKLIHADLLAAREDGRSVIVIDSQGDLINKLMRLDLFSPAGEDNLADRLVLIDPADVEFPAALNLFDAHLDRVRGYSAADRERVLNGVIELYELFFGAFLGAELTQKQGVIFKYLARLMLAIPDATIHTLMRIMEDGKPYKAYMEQLDGSARHFFETEFFHPSFAATKKQVLRRLWGVLSTPAFERMFTQPRNKLDLFEAMNEGKIVLVSTAKDLLKREGSQLLGRFFIAMITQAALERSTLKEYLRRPCFVYVDEAQEYFDDSIETILNQARKYRVGLTLAHQTLDQLSPRLRSAILANTSMKCAGGVSAKDARALAEELRTTHEFIEGMKRRGPRTEFALWVKHLTDKGIRLTVPLGFLEKQPTLDDLEHDALIAANRVRYCGTLADISMHVPPSPEPHERTRQAPEVPASEMPARPEDAPATARAEPQAEPVDREPAPARVARPPIGDRELGKGGKQHRYLQALVKELAEQQGLKATLEAPAPNGGQVDVLIERNGVLAAVEISVSTPVEHERDNLRKCLEGGYPRIAVVLAKSKTVQTSYRAALAEIVAEHDRERVQFLTPEEIPEFLISLAPAPEPAERVVKGYRVKAAFTSASPQDALARQDALAKLIAKSLRNQQD